MNCSTDANCQARLKELCKVARKKQGLSNQNIADLISTKFNIPDYSVNTVNNFFSDRSKAATMFTVGTICSVLNVSIDETFDISCELTNEARDILCGQLAGLEQDVRFANKEIDKLKEIISEKDIRLKQAHEALDHYRKASLEDRKRVPLWAFNVLLVAVALLVLAIAAYLIIFDISNAGYGLFRLGICSVCDWLS